MTKSVKLHGISIEAFVESVVVDPTLRACMRWTERGLASPIEFNGSPLMLLFDWVFGASSIILNRTKIKIKIERNMWR